MSQAPENRREDDRMVESARAQAAAESDIERARRWRGRTPLEHAEALRAVLELADTILAGRGRAAAREPLLHRPPVPRR